MGKYSVLEIYIPLLGLFPQFYGAHKMRSSWFVQSNTETFTWSLAISWQADLEVTVVQQVPCEKSHPAFPVNKTTQVVIPVRAEHSRFSF